MSNSALMAREIHDEWKSRYRNAENAEFYRAAYEIVRRYFAKPGGWICDLGCGTGEKTIRLAELGHDVIGVDFAQVALEEARAKIAEAGYCSRVKLVRADLMCLPFRDAVFEGVIAWGVLMHVPELEKAIAQLSRVIRQNGRVIVYDGNPRSLDAKLLRLLKQITRRGRSEKTKLGIENWVESKYGSILVRWTYYSVLKALFSNHGIIFDGRRAGQFTELYVYVKSAILRRWVHKWNNTYFRYIGWPSASHAVMLFGRKVTDKRAVEKSETKYGDSH
jgi:ubiquinone/menaquinone biosynthesis C-methylase UbiE